MPPPETKGILLLAHGTPQSIDEFPEFLKSIKRGGTVEEEVLNEVIRRYHSIGGLSPLIQISNDQTRELQRLLDAKCPNEFLVELGNKHCEPSIEKSAESLLAQNVTEITAIVLTPHYSTMGTGEYLNRVKDAIGQAPVKANLVKSWWNNDKFLELLALRVQSALLELPFENSAVIFSAHSLPTRILDIGDPYPNEHIGTASKVAEKLNLSKDRFKVAWQSAGMSGGSWLEPSLALCINDFVKEGFENIVICPDGFTSDHTEILYDLDIEAKHLADSLGAKTYRTKSLNADPAFIEVLADIAIHPASFDMA